jgi:hypothetical protein
LLPSRSSWGGIIADVFQTLQHAHASLWCGARIRLSGFKIRTVFGLSRAAAIDKKKRGRPTEVMPAPISPADESAG